MSGDLTARDVEQILANVLFEESETCMGSVEERRIARVMLAALEDARSRAQEVRDNAQDAARDVLAVTLDDLESDDMSSDAIAFELLAALASVGWLLERDDQWEYNVHGHNSTTPMLNAPVTEDEARGWLDPRFNRTVVRRRPAGEWEVAP